MSGARAADGVRRLFVLSLGFEEKFAVRMITRHGLDRGDGLLVVTGPRVERVERTIRYLHEFVSKYYGGEVGFEVVELDPARGFDWMVMSVVDTLLERHGGYDLIIVNLSGGMRAVCLAVFTAVLLLDRVLGDRVRVELETEDSSAFVEIPRGMLALPQVVSELGLEETVVRLLRLLSERARTADELASGLGRDVTTVRRHLIRLRELGLVVSDGSRPARYSLSSQGWLVLRLLGAMGGRRGRSA